MIDGIAKNDGEKSSCHYIRNKCDVVCSDVYGIPPLADPGGIGPYHIIWGGGRAAVADLGGGPPVQI